MMRKIPKYHPKKHPKKNNCTKIIPCTHSCAQGIYLFVQFFYNGYNIGKGLTAGVHQPGDLIVGL